MWVNYPHMPTGATASIQDFERIISFAKKHNILIVNDNPYSFILNDHPRSILEVSGAKEVAIELNSLRYHDDDPIKYAQAIDEEIQLLASLLGESTGSVLPYTNAMLFIR